MFSSRQLLRVSSSLFSSIRNLDLRDPVNLGRGALGAGMVLLGAGLFRRSVFGLGLTIGGGAILSRTFGHSEQRDESAAASVPFATTAGVPGNCGRKLVRSVKINRSASEIFEFVRNLENAPRFLKVVESVEVLDDVRSFWIGRTPIGATAEWYLEILNEHPGEMISWQTLPGSELQHAGSIRMESCADGSTDVKIALEYLFRGVAPGDELNGNGAQPPEVELMEDLARLKFLLEKGVSTVRVTEAEMTEV